MENNKKLSLWESAAIITGYGIGGGVMAMPYLAERNGLPMAFLILTIAFFSSVILHLMIADMCLKTGSDSQMIGLFSKYVFVGKFKKAMTVTFFVIMLLVLLTNLATYIAGAQEIITPLTGISPFIAKVLFYIVAAAVALFGLKVLGISEKYAVGVIYILVFTLAGFSFFHISRPLPFRPGTVNQGLAYFGMAMFSFSAFFSVPQAVTGLDGDVKQIRKAITIGMLNNYILIVVITISALLSSTEVTQVAMVGWSRGIGSWAEIVGSVFTLLAMLTTYWSISLALADIIREQTNWNDKISWVAATVPSILITFIDMGGFMEFMRLAGGLIAIIIALMVVPAYRKSRREEGEGLLKNWGCTAMQVFIIIAYIFMAVGNVVTV